MADSELRFRLYTFQGFLMLTNDNDPAQCGAPLTVSDAHGQAALLLVESLIHGLCEKTVLNTDEAIDIVETALDVQLDYVGAANGSAASMRRSHALLAAIAASLMTDGRSEPARPRLV